MAGFQPRAAASGSSPVSPSCSGPRPSSRAASASRRHCARVPLGGASSRRQARAGGGAGMSGSGCCHPPRMTEYYRYPQQMSGVQLVVTCRSRPPAPSGRRMQQSREPRAASGGDQGRSGTGGPTENAVSMLGITVRRFRVARRGWVQPDPFCIRPRSLGILSGCEPWVSRKSCWSSTPRGRPVPLGPDALAVAARRGEGEDAEQHDRAEREEDPATSPGRPPDAGAQGAAARARHPPSAPAWPRSTPSCGTGGAAPSAAARAVGAHVAALATSPVAVDPVADRGRAVRPHARRLRRSPPARCSPAAATCTSPSPTTRRASPSSTGSGSGCRC